MFDLPWPTAGDWHFSVSAERKTGEQWQMLYSKLTSRPQTTLPKEVREALALVPGDVIAYRIEDGRVVLQKASAMDRDYLKSVESTLSEWNSPEDAEAFDDL